MKNYFLNFELIYYLIQLILIIGYQFQVRDEYRSDFDSGRGGYGKIIQQKVTPLGEGAYGR